jgi:hypothetical protein
MSVAITAQVPVESFTASSPATASPQAGQGTGATTEQGLVDFFVKARLDAGNGQTAQAVNSAASSGEMLGKLREFIEQTHRGDAENKATRVKRKAAAVQAKAELAALDTFGSVGQFGPAGQFGSPSQSGSVGQSTALNRYASVQPAVGLHPGPASEPMGRGLGLGDHGRVFAQSQVLINDLQESTIRNMWTQVVMHGSKKLTENVMTLLKGQ